MALASWMGGILARREMVRRVRLWRQIQLALELMQAEMELHMPSAAELFSEVGRQLGGELGMFFQGCAAEMHQVSGRPPQAAMRIQLEQWNPGREETALLLELGGSLGRYDLLGQARALELLKRRAVQAASEAEEILRRKARTSMTASVCAGLCLIIILL